MALNQTKKRRRRTTEERIAELQSRIDALREASRQQREFSPEAVSAHREKLELSAADYGELVGVSALTIYKWEKGETRPRAAQAQKWLAVRDLTKRDAWRKLGYA